MSVKAPMRYDTPPAVASVMFASAPTVISSLSSAARSSSPGAAVSDEGTPSQVSLACQCTTSSGLISWRVLCYHSRVGLVFQKWVLVCSVTAVLVDDQLREGKSERSIVSSGRLETFEFS